MTKLWLLIGKPHCLEKFQPKGRAFGVQIFASIFICISCYSLYINSSISDYLRINCDSYFPQIINQITLRFVKLPLLSNVWKNITLNLVCLGSVDRD